jgi:hypothetical protein
VWTLEKTDHGQRREFIKASKQMVQEAVKILKTIRAHTHRKGTYLIF